MTEAKAGDTVRVHYTGRLDDGTIFDATQNRGPHQYTIGDGSVATGFDRAVIGMTVGQTRTVTLSPTEAFGRPLPGRVGDIPRKDLSPEIKQAVGQRFEWTQPDGRVAIATIVAVKKHFITLDVNHPLAGKTVTFDIELVGVVA